MCAYTVAEIHAEVERYLAGEIDASDLESSLIPLVWDEAGPAEAIELALDVVLIRFEHSGGHITDQQFQDGLRELLPAAAAAP